MFSKFSSASVSLLFILETEMSLIWSVFMFVFCAMLSLNSLVLWVRGSETGLGLWSKTL